MQAQPGVVEPEAHEGEEEVELLVDLRHRVSDAALEVAVAVVAALVEEGVHLLVADLAEAVRGHDVGRLVVVAVLEGLRRLAGGERIW